MVPAESHKLNDEGSTPFLASPGSFVLSLDKWIIHQELGIKKIKKEEITYYLALGWRIGRK